jgi:hypothetical protein
VTRLLDYNVLEAIHIVAVAVWLGTDIATFALLWRLRHPGLNPATRGEMVGLVDLLDLGPRSAAVVLLTLGVTLTYLGRWGFTGANETLLLGGSVLLCALWLLLVWYGFWVSGARGRSEKGERWAPIVGVADLWLRVVLTAALLVAAIWSLGSSGGPIGVTWLSIKLILFAAVVALGIATRTVLSSLESRLGAARAPTEQAGRTSSSVRLVMLVMLATWACFVTMIWLSVTPH